MMRENIIKRLLPLCVYSLMTVVAAEVSHEEIRGTIQSLIYSYNQLDNKLERHEHRERALGELLKKAMQTLQKGQKSLEPINGVFGRLDERVSQIETMLITQEEKYNIQTEKLGEALEHIFKWMQENDKCYRRPPIPAQGINISETEDPQNHVNEELFKAINKFSEKIDKLIAGSTDITKVVEGGFQNAPAAKEIFTKIEDKLSKCAISSTDSINVKDKQVLDKINNIAETIFELIAVTRESIGLTPKDKVFMQKLANESLNTLDNLKIDMITASDNVMTTVIARIKDTEEKIQNNHNKVVNRVSDSSVIVEKLYGEINSSYSKLNGGLEILPKFNNILMANSEYILDTQRKVEFSTLQIVQKLGDLLNKQSSDYSTLLKERVDKVEENVVSNQLHMLSNLSTIVESEISHVWHQIEIMYNEITDSKDLLHLMHGRNEVYVNSTFSIMDSMSIKVEEIKGRMLDMDSNLNFLLGKLSVMSQEFKNIKSGLAESLEQMRNTFHTIQEKMPTQSSAKSVYETELNLLKKRNVV